MAALTSPIRVRALGISWSAPGEEELFQADSLRAAIAPTQLLAGDFVILSLDLDAPRLRLARAPGEREWNVERGLAALLASERPAPAATPPRSIRIDDAVVRNGLVEVRPPSGESVIVREIAARIPRIAISGPRQPVPTVDLALLTATLELPEEALEVDIAISNGELRFPSGRLEFTVARITAESSSFTDARGEYRFGAKGLGLDASVRGERVQLADLRVLLPRAPQEGTARFDLRITTDVAGRSTLELSAVDLTADGTRIRGSLGLAFGGAEALTLLGVDLVLEPLTIALIEGFTGPLPYGGEITGRIRGPPSRLTFDLVAQLTAPGVAVPFTAGLVGEAVFSGVGFQLASLDVDLRRVPLLAFRPFIPGLSMEGVVSGHLFMEGMPGEVPTRLDLRLEVATGVLTLAGVIDLSGAIPVYDLTGSVADLRLQDLLEPPVPPVLLTARFALTGEGVRPATATARLQLAGLFSGWQTGPADSIVIEAAVAAGNLALDTAALRLGPLEFSAGGSWRFEPPVSGQIRYRLAAATLAPFGPYFPPVGDDRFAAGSLLASGTLSGPLAAPRLTGTLAAASLAYDGWRADTLSATYDIVLQRPLSEAVISVVAQELETPIGPYTDVTIALSLADSLLTLDLRGEGAAGRGPIVAAVDGRIGPGERRELVVRRLRFELEGKEWALAHSTRIEWSGGPAFIVEDLLLRQTEGTGRVAIDGRYPPAAAEELRVEIVDLPIADLLMTAGYGPNLTGLLSLDLRVRGPPAAAQAGGTFRLVDGSYRGQEIALLEGTLLAEDRRLAAQAIAQLDTAGAMQINASLPLVLDLEGIPDLTIPRNEPMRVSLVADSLALRLFALAIPEIRDVEGTLDARVDLSGTPARPTLAGSAQIQNGALTIVPVNQRYDQIFGEFSLAENRVLIEALRVHSDGWATVDGAIALTDPSNPALDLTANFNEFRALGTDDLEPAAVNGVLLVTGTLREPVIAGAVTIDDGNIAIPSFRSPGAAPIDFTTAEMLAEGEEAATETVSLFDRLRLDSVVVRAGDNLWFVTEQFRAQLAGELIINKMGDGLEIFGTLEGDRGVFTLRVGPLVRRFTLVNASIRFFGTPDPNPALDITASRIIPGAGGQLTEILLQLSGTLNQPVVSVTTAEGAEVPESELLSFLLFGRPSFAAPGPFPLGGPILEEAVFGIGSLAELASIGLEEALISDLGLPLDYFLIQPSQGPLGGLGAPTIVLGQEIAPDVYLTVNTGFGGYFGPAGSSATAWSAALLWRITSQWSLELSVEPVNPARFFRGIGTALPIVGFERQVIVELRRRWTY